MRKIPLLFCAALAAACSGEPGQPQSSSRRGAPVLEAPAPAPAPAPAEDFVFPADRLAAIQAELNALGAPYGAQVEMESLQSAAAHRLKSFLRGFNSSDAKAMALPEPEMIDFTEGEKASRGPMAKWLEGGKWTYGDHLPRDGSAVSEAWTRVIGSRDLSTGYQIFIQTGVPQDKWRRRKWQPLRKRWSYFTEEEERAGINSLLAGRYAAADPDSRNSARFECERMQRAVEKAVAAGRDPSGYYGTMRQALVRAFDKDLEREALKYLAEEGAPAALLR